MFVRAILFVPFEKLVCVSVIKGLINADNLADLVDGLLIP